jgi:ABC-type multidrug transport system fused ATPase/permease subunit
MSEITLKTLAIRFKWGILLTTVLVFFESIFSVLVPLFIGIAINDLLDESIRGVIQLIVLGLLLVLANTIRRYADARIYSGIYLQIAPEMVEKEQEKDSSISKIIARSNLLYEFVEFLEWSMPEVVGGAVTLIGTLIIIANLNLNVFYGCLALLVLVIFVYATTGKFNFKLNENYNNQVEKEVDELGTKDHNIIKNYYKALMEWNIKLSDLETTNYLIVMLGVGALLVYTPIAVIKGSNDYYGLVFSAVLYVFEYTGALIVLPDHMQQIIRLNEISNRLAE